MKRFLAKAFLLLALFAQPAGAETLATFSATYDSGGRRLTLDIAPTGESIAFAYDAAGRLADETHALSGATVTQGYAYSLTGDRLKHTLRHSPGQGQDGAEIYKHNQRHELLQVTNPDGSVTQLAYDLNGNTIRKSRCLTALLTIAYSNGTGTTTQCTLSVDGVAQPAPLDFPPTTDGDTYGTIAIPIIVGSTIKLETGDADGSNNNAHTINIDCITVSSLAPGWSDVFEAEAATDVVRNGVSVIAAPAASGGQAVSGFGGPGTSISFVNLPYSSQGVTDYTWDAVHRLTDVDHHIAGIGVTSCRGSALHHVSQFFHPVLLLVVQATGNRVHNHTAFREGVSEMSV